MNVHSKYVIIFPNRSSVRQITVLLVFYRVLYRAHTRKTKSIISPILIVLAYKTCIYLESKLNKLQNGIYIHDIFSWSFGHLWQEA
jgi:hypothetical protein